MITFIFGAGASFGSGGCEPTNPPLGNKLFEKLIEREGDFSKIDEKYKSVFISEGFEAGMALLSNDNRILNPLQKELAMYFSGFKARQDNAYVRLFSKLHRYIDQINIVTLNYDLLLEQALAFHGLQTDYNGSGGGVPVLKIHGSSNFLPQLGGIKFSGNTMIGVSSYMEGLEVKVASSQQEVIKWCQEPSNDDISPVLAIYEKGKRVVVNSILIKELQDKYVLVTKYSSLIVLVGIRYIEHDAHVWLPILESGAEILVIDPYPDEIVKWIEINNLINVSVIQSSFDQSIWEITKKVNSVLL
jgi:hypothetical protein